VTCDELVDWASTRRHLSLAKAMISDLAPLAGFPALESLDVEDNLVTDLAPLRGLARLAELRTGWNDIQDFSPVAGLLERGGRVFGRGLQNTGWQPRRDTDFLKACLAIDAGKPLDAAVVTATLAIKRAACLGSVCGCYTASDGLQKARELNLTDAENVTTLAPLRGLSNLQYLKLAADVPGDAATLGSLENLREVGGRAWPN
jgi:Leucine-rich repeat (LRR) protein